MACLTTEKSSPLTQQKRCSLPGPMGTLNLYPTHQQRRLSERGLMIYKPSKPDIDLIRDFTSSGRRGSTSFCTDATGLHLHHYPNAPRRHSAVNIAGLPCQPGPDSGLTSGWPPTYTPERRHSAVVPGSSPYFSHPTGGGICPGSISPTTTSNTSSTFHFTNTSNSQIHHGPKPSHSSACCSTGAHRRKSSAGIPSATPSHCFVATPCPSISVGNESGPTTLLNNNNNNSGTPLGAKGCQKVRLRIQKNSNSKDKFELTPIMGSGSINSSAENVSEAEDRLDFLSHPKLDTRRHSDSATVRRPPHICITPDRPLNRKKGTGIVCSTGDLFRLKCLTSSATEIRCLTKPKKMGGAENDLVEDIADEEPDSPTTVLGNRSRSFDATIVMARKGPGSSWFSRRHQPIAVKLPVPIDSPTITTETSYFPSSASTAAAFRTPILTITNENASKSELIQIPSPPAGSPVSSRASPEERTKVAWDKNGFVLDAAVLGIAIENHLRKVDMRRRATFSAIHQPPASSIPEPKAGTRARSASACVIQMPSRSEDAMNKSTSSREAPGGRKLSLTTGTSGSRLFCWDKGSSPGSSEKPGPSGSTNGKGQQVVPVLTAVSLTNSTGGQPSFETHLHHHIPHHGIASTSYFTALESPSGENFINFRTTEDDIQEEPGKEEGEDTDDDDEPQETQAFLRRNLEGGSGSGRAGSSVVVVTSQVASSSSSSSSYFSSILNRAHPNNNANHNPGTGTSAEQSSSTAPGSSSRANQGGGVSICGAIRDFLLHSIRS